LFLNIVAQPKNIYKLHSVTYFMKELIIQIRVNESQTATIMKKQGFDNTVSSSYEIIGILQNLIKIEQDKMAENSTSVTKSKNG